MPRRLTFVALAVVGVAVLGGLDLWRTATAPAIIDFNRAIKRDLPLGSTPAQTKAFLRTHGVKDQWVGDIMNADMDPFSARFKNGGLMYASIPNISQGLLTIGSIDMKFAFDAKRHLRDYYVHTSLTVFR